MTRREVVRKWDRRKREIIAAIPDGEIKEWYKRLLGNLKPPRDTKKAEQWMDDMEKFYRDANAQASEGVAVKQRLRKGIG